jgi:hypothetical protein
MLPTIKRHRKPLGALTPPLPYAWYGADVARVTDTPFGDGDVVDLWRNLATADRTSASQRLIQTDTLGPIYKVNIINSRPVVRFSGSPFAMRRANFIFQPGGYTLFAVLQVTGSNATRYYMEADSGVAPRIMQFRESDLNTFGFNPNNNVPSTNVVTVTATAANWNVYSAHYDGRTAAAYVNGNTWTRTATNDTPNSGTHDLAVGAATNLTGYFIGDIAELLIYNPAISEFQRQQVEAYLGRKYLLQVSR